MGNRLREFDSKLVYNKKYLKAEIKYYKGKTNTLCTFTTTKYQKKIVVIFSFLVILIDSVFRTGKNYYLQMFLEECKYVIKEKMIHNQTIDDDDVKTSSFSDEKTLLEKIQTEKSSDYEEILKKIQMKKKSDKENSDEENSDKENFDEEHFKKY